MSKQLFSKRNISVVALLASLFMLSACWSVAQRDEIALAEVVTLSKKVMTFFSEMQIIPEAEREYSKFEAQYAEIKGDITALLILNRARLNNEDTVEQIEILSGHWDQDIKKHKEDNKMIDFIIQQRIIQYSDSFSAIILGEQVKEAEGE